MSKLERNLAKLKKEPRAFVVDAIRKRVPAAAPLKSGEYMVEKFDVVDGLVVLENEALAAQVRAAKSSGKRLVLTLAWK